MTALFFWVIHWHPIYLRLDNSLIYNQNRETMKPVTRLIVATLSGLLFGIVCYTFASMGEGELPYPVAAQIISSRILMGFAIALDRQDIHT